MVVGVGGTQSGSAESSLPGREGLICGGTEASATALRWPQELDPAGWLGDSPGRWEPGGEAHCERGRAGVEGGESRQGAQGSGGAEACCLATAAEDLGK